MDPRVARGPGIALFERYSVGPESILRRLQLRLFFITIAAASALAGGVPGGFAAPSPEPAPSVHPDKAPSATTSNPSPQRAPAPAPAPAPAAVAPAANPPPPPPPPPAPPATTAPPKPAATAKPRPSAKPKPATKPIPPAPVTQPAPALGKPAAVSLERGRGGGSRSHNLRWLVVAMLALAALAVGIAAVPPWVLRPAGVARIVAPHRASTAIAGVGVIVSIGAAYLLTRTGG